MSSGTASTQVRAELEVCVESEAGLSLCRSAGVDRIELCAALSLGGLTPSLGFMRRAALADPSSDICGTEATRPQVYAMIRARAGDFCFSEAEVSIMCDDVRAARESGLTGVVLGAATHDGNLDCATLARLCNAAGPLGKTLHRVIDLLGDPLKAIDQAVSLGFDRILTSGGATRAGDGLVQLRLMQAHAGSRIQIMAGAGLSPASARLIRSQTGIQSFHSSCKRTAGKDVALEEFGFSGRSGVVDVALIREYQRMLVIDQ